MRKSQLQWCGALEAMRQYDHSDDEVGPKGTNKPSTGYSVKCSEAFLIQNVSSLPSHTKKWLLDVYSGLHMLSVVFCRCGQPGSHNSCPISNIEPIHPTCIQLFHLVNAHQCKTWKFKIFISWTVLCFLISKICFQFFKAIFLNLFTPEELLK